MKKRAKVHMLGTDGVSSITKGKGEYSHIFHFDPEDEYVEDDDEYPIHLYFTTDEEIKEGDWFYDDLDIPQNMRVKQLKKAVDYSLIREDMRESEKERWTYARKIIATTDPKLLKPQIKQVNWMGSERVVSLPQPSQALIKAYCEQGGFDEVDVEYYNMWKFDKKLQKSVDIYWPFVSAVDGTITTHLIDEKMYSLKNVLNKIEEFEILHRDGWDIDELHKWIKENL